MSAGALSGTDLIELLSKRVGDGLLASLKNAVFLERFARRHSLLQSLPDGLFPPRLFERPSKNVLLRRPRNKADAI